MDRTKYEEDLIEDIKRNINEIVDAEALLLDKEEIRNSLKEKLKKYIISIIPKNEILSKLDVLFKYERHYLELMKEFKEELKFAASIQEDLRRERSQFFTQILGEVYNTMKKSEVAQEISSKWINELVVSYTNSINLSSGLAETNLVNTVNWMKKTATDVKTKNEGEKEPA